VASLAPTDDEVAPLKTLNLPVGVLGTAPPRPVLGADRWCGRVEALRWITCSISATAGSPPQAPNSPRSWTRRANDRHSSSWPRGRRRRSASCSPRSTTRVQPRPVGVPVPTRPAQDRW